MEAEPDDVPPLKRRRFDISQWNTSTDDLAIDTNRLYSSNLYQDDSWHIFPHLTPASSNNHVQPSFQHGFPSIGNWNNDEAVFRDVNQMSSFDLTTWSSTPVTPYTDGLPSSTTPMPESVGVANQLQQINQDGPNRNHQKYGTLTQQFDNWYSTDSTPTQTDIDVSTNYHELETALHLPQCGNNVDQDDIVCFGRVRQSNPWSNNIY